MRRPSVLLALSALLLGGLATPASAATDPPDSWPRPASGTYSLTGHGWGHGIGMSQYGAYGAARAGRSWYSILEHYYPGTTRTWQGNPRLDVRLTALGSSAFTVVAADGLRFSDGQRTITLPASVDRWRIVPEGGGITLQWRTGSSWTSSTGWRRWTASPFTLTNPKSKTVRTVLPSGGLRDYRDAVRVWPNGTGLMAVNNISTEAYLWSVVPSEMPSGWSAEALRSQAVAARTYASRARTVSTVPTYDTCDSTSCQVYKGVADYTASGSLSRRNEWPASTGAVSATAGYILTSGGRPALTMFSSSNGGWSVGAREPYLPSQEDPYDGVVPGSPHTWSATIAVSTLESKFSSIGSLRSLDVVTRDGNGEWGGRTVSVRVVGSAGTQTVSGETFRSRLGLRSAWWTVSP